MYVCSHHSLWHEDVPVTLALRKLALCLAHVAKDRFRRFSDLKRLKVGFLASSLEWDSVQLLGSPAVMGPDNITRSEQYLTTC